MYIYYFCKEKIIISRCFSLFFFFLIVISIFFFPSDTITISVALKLNMISDFISQCPWLQKIYCKVVHVFLTSH